MQDYLGSDRSDPLTFTEWPIALCHPPLEKFKRTKIHRGKCYAVWINALFLSHIAPLHPVRAAAVTLYVFMLDWF